MTRHAVDYLTWNEIDMTVALIVQNMSDLVAMRPGKQ